MQCECGSETKLTIGDDRKVQYICKKCGKVYDTHCIQCRNILFSTYEGVCALCGASVAYAEPEEMPPMAQKEIAAAQS